MVTPRNPRDINIPFPWVDGLERRTQEELYMDFLALGRAATGTRWRTIVIAAADSSEVNRSSADYVCSGTADETIINAAILALEAKSSTAKLGRVVFLEGTYTLSDEILINSLTSRTLFIEGMGGGVAGAYADTIGGTHFVQTNAAKAAFNCGGPAAGQGATVVFENLNIQGASNNAVALLATRDMTLGASKLTIRQTGAGNCIAQTSSTGSGVWSRVEDCHLVCGAGTALGLDVGSALGGQSMAVNNRIFVTSVNGSGITTSNQLATGPSYYLAHNTITGNGSSGSGIGIKANGASSNQSVILGNKVTGFSIGIYFAGYQHLVLGNMIASVVTGITDGFSETRAGLVMGNTIINATTTGIRVGTNLCTAMTVMGNKVVAFGTQCVNAILIAAASTDTGVFYNDVYGSYTGADVSDLGTNTRREGSFLTSSSVLDANARVGVRKNSTGSTFLRRRLNLIEGTGLAITTADDSVDEEVDITLALSRAMTLRKGTGTTFNRGRISLIEGTNITMTVADDPGSDEVDVTINATAPAAAVQVKVDGSTIGSEGTLKFISGTGVTLAGVDNTGAGQVEVTVASSGGGGGSSSPLLNYALFR